MSDQTPNYDDIIALVQSQLVSAGTAFSMGVMGAIAEYFGPSQLSEEKTGGHARRDGGGLTINLPNDVRAVAYETVSGAGDRWSQGVLFIYPQDIADMGVGVGLKELGPDVDALLDKDKERILFDLGLGHPHFSFAIRTDNKNLIAKLRDAKGRDLFTKAPNVLHAVMELEPDRVVQTFAGRIEATSPYADLLGPHTHLVPNMIGKTAHAATLPVPSGHAVGLTMMPKSPWMTADAKPSDFDREAYDAFQSIFDKFAPDELRAEKTRLLNALKSGIPAKDYKTAMDKSARLQARATLRQLQQIAPDTPNLKDWFMKLDRTGWAD